MRWSSIVFVVLAACPRPPPPVLEEAPKPPAPPAVQIPGGCEALLTGEWTSERDPTFRYRMIDDGGTVTAEAYRAFAPNDGGAPNAAAQLVLRRTPKGFVGQTLSPVPQGSGPPCKAAFPTEITACGPATLTLQSAASTPVGEGCQTPPSPQPAAMLEHRLARSDAGAL